MNKLYQGFKGETIAKNYLVDCGYRIIERNYKTEIGEIDLIITDNITLVFVEVKARSSLKYGYPAEAVSVFKQRKLSQVAAQYIKRHQLAGVNVRFDVVEVLDGNVRHIKGAFDSYLRY